MPAKRKVSAWARKRWLLSHVYLASDAATYVTGSTVVIDWGMTFLKMRTLPTEGEILVFGKIA